MKNKLLQPQLSHRTSGPPGWSMSRNQKGDTIIEVLIAMAIISSVLGGAYVLATRSLRGTRVAQERTQATKLAQGQLERLKYAARTDGNFDAYRTSDYCISKQDPASPYNVSRRAKSGDYHADCKIGETQYKLNITYVLYNGNPPIAGFGTFKVRADWARLGGGNESVTLYYQL